MKKTTKAKTPQTPAAKATKKAEAAPKAARPLRVLKPIALTAPVTAPVTASVPAPQGPKTVITARVDVGFGNTLYIRGEGPGLTWDSGVPLDCSGPAEWTISFSGAQRPIVFKFLLNDEAWALGENLSVEPGAAAEFSPAF